MKIISDLQGGDTPSSSVLSTQSLFKVFFLKTSLLHGIACNPYGEFKFTFVLFFFFSFQHSKALTSLSVDNTWNLFLKVWHLTQTLWQKQTKREIKETTKQKLHCN